MADVDEETIEEIFNAELERLQAAMEELDDAPAEEPEICKSTSQQKSGHRTGF